MTLSNIIPRQDIIDGLPIRWAYHVWLTGGGYWTFRKWREYLLSFNQRGYEMIPEIFQDWRFYREVRRFLRDNDAETLAGFIAFWLKCCEEYERLLKVDD